MTATAWAIRYDDSAPSEPWIASHLDQGVTVFGSSIDTLGAEIAREQRCILEIPLIETQVDFECLERIDQIAAEHRREVGEARWAELQAGWE